MMDVCVFTSRVSMCHYLSLTKQNVFAAYKQHTLKLICSLYRITQAKGVGVISRRALISWL